MRVALIVVVALLVLATECLSSCEEAGRYFDPFDVMENGAHKGDLKNFIEVFVYFNGMYYTAPAPSVEPDIRAAYRMGYHISREPYYVSCEFLSDPDNYNS